MRDDLLHARASVDWAVAQLPAFKIRLDAWLKDNIHVARKELPPDASKDVLLAVEKEPLPLAFQVEAGVYVNAIRSSLDILAATLANRHCQTLIDDAYFPVASSAANFDAGNYKGNKFVKALPTAEQAIIKALKPYKGGNNLLYALHLLDIVRKHQRLLTVEIRPAKLSFMAWGLSQSFSPVTTGWMRSGDDETVIGLIAKGAPNPKINLTMQVSLNETAYFNHREIVVALHEFATLTNSIIREFDIP